MALDIVANEVPGRRSPVPGHKGFLPYEFHMLYGIQRGEQSRLAAAREDIRVLIAYGTYWFPWCMRRLAERPANVGFVVKRMFR